MQKDNYRFDYIFCSISFLRVFFRCPNERSHFILNARGAEYRLAEKRADLDDDDVVDGDEARKNGGAVA